MSDLLPPCTLHQVSEHVWWYTPDSRTDRPSLAAVVGDARVVLLDVGASPKHTQQCLSALSKNGIKSPDFAIATHWHWDHIFGLEAIDCPLIAHEETGANIRRMMTLDYSDANLPTLIEEGHEVEFTRHHMMLEMSDAERRNLILRSPEIEFQQALTLDLGGVTATAHHVGGDHAADSVVIHIPEDKVLFMGDCFYYTVYQEPQRYTAAEVIPLINTLEAFDAQHFIIGHNGEVLDQQTLYREFAFIRDAYQWIDANGKGDIAALKQHLLQSYSEDNIEDILPPIMAGLEY